MQEHSDEMRHLTGKMQKKQGEQSFKPRLRAWN